MTMSTDEKIAILQAYEEGKKIQFYDSTSDHWCTTSEPLWNFHAHDYRVKVEPREVYIEFCNSGDIYQTSTTQRHNPAKSWIKFREVLDV